MFEEAGCHYSPLVRAPLTANAEVLVDRVPHVAVEAEAFPCKHRETEPITAALIIVQSLVHVSPASAIPKGVLSGLLENFYHVAHNHIFFFIKRWKLSKYWVPENFFF